MVKVLEMGTPEDKSTLETIETKVYILFCDGTTPWVWHEGHLCETQLRNLTSGHGGCEDKQLPCWVANQQQEWMACRGRHSELSSHPDVAPAFLQQSSQWREEGRTRPNFKPGVWMDNRRLTYNCVNSKVYYKQRWLIYESAMPTWRRSTTYLNKQLFL